MISKKKLYKGEFNYFGETYKLFTQAESEVFAFYNFINQLRKKLKVSKNRLFYYFDGSRDNYYIREEVKKDESQDRTKILAKE